MILNQWVFFCKNDMLFSSTTEWSIAEKLTSVEAIENFLLLQ